MRLPLRTLFLLLPVWVAMPAKADYTPDFSTGVMPAGVAVANESGFNPADSYYRHGWTADGWTLERFGTRGYVLMAPSHTAEAEPKAMRSVLTLPPYEVTEQTWLRWSACSMVPKLPESYAVEIRAEGSDKAETVLTVDAENADWTTRMIPLARYAGKKCAVSFVCTSVNRYEFMLDKIALTEPKAPQWSGTNTTPGYGDLSGTEISGKITNFGAPAEVSAVLVLDANGVETGRQEVERAIGTAESLDFAVKGAAQKDIRTKYTVSLLMADGTKTDIKDLAGSYFSSTFTRRHLVDKGTGMWCNNCPTGTVQLEGLQRRFGSSVIPVETHANPDVLVNPGYFSALKFYGIPAFRMDRNSRNNNAFKDMEPFYDVPANHEVVFEKVSLAGPDLLSLRVVVRHPETETATFRLGYVITADFSSDTYYQQNSTYGVSGERFYFLPTVIPGDMVDFGHVSVTSEHAFDGIGATSTYTADGMSHSVYEFTVQRPELLADFRNATAVAYALNDADGVVLNASSASLDKDFDFSGVEDIAAPDNTQTDGPVEYYTLQGIRIANPAQGVFIRRQGNKSSKIILK